MTTTRDEYRRAWWQYITANAEAHGLTVVDVESGPVTGDDSRLWVEVRDCASGEVIYGLPGDPVTVAADFVQAKADRRWLTTDEIDRELDQLMTAIYGPGAGAA